MEVLDPPDSESPRGLKELARTVGKALGSHQPFQCQRGSMSYFMLSLLGLLRALRCADRARNQGGSLNRSSYGREEESDLGCSQTVTRTGRLWAGPGCPIGPRAFQPGDPFNHAGTVVFAVTVLGSGSVLLWSFEMSCSMSCYCCPSAVRCSVS